MEMSGVNSDQSPSLTSSPLTPFIIDCLMQTYPRRYLGPDSLSLTISNWYQSKDLIDFNYLILIDIDTDGDVEVNSLV